MRTTHLPIPSGLAILAGILLHFTAASAIAEETAAGRLGLTYEQIEALWGEGEPSSIAFADFTDSWTYEHDGWSIHVGYFEHKSAAIGLVPTERRAHPDPFGPSNYEAFLVKLAGGTWQRDGGAIIEESAWKQIEEIATAYTSGDFIMVILEAARKANKAQQEAKAADSLSGL